MLAFDKLHLFVTRNKPLWVSQLHAVLVPGVSVRLAGPQNRAALLSSPL